ncbi:hypothetical protein JCM6882_009698 [Rhodosporidiobolus microsporus]
MRLPLTPTPACSLQLSTTPSSSDPPLAFIDNEPFLVEMQGILELPPGEQEEAARENEGRGEMEGVRVGKVDLSDPKKPVLRIAHHRLEGKLETLMTPYVLLRTTRVPVSPSTSASSSLDAASSSTKRPTTDDAGGQTGGDSLEPASKRAKLDPSLSSSNLSSLSSSTLQTRIEIAALIRRKIVFSRRPEPLIDVSSEADPAFAKERAKATKVHPLARLGGEAGVAAGVGGGGALKGGAAGVGKASGKKP